MRGICLKCGHTVKSGKLYFVYDKELKGTVPVCADCKIKYYEAKE